MMQMTGTQAAFSPHVKNQKIKIGIAIRIGSRKIPPQIFLNVFFEGCPKKSKDSKSGLYLAFERSDR
jgi:hypothetical protein